MLLMCQVLSGVVFIDCNNVTDVSGVEWCCLRGL